MIANYLTISRIIISIILLFQTNINIVFIALYTIAGLTDMLDGYIARKTNTSSELGSRLDTIADLFFGVVILKILWNTLNTANLIWFIIIAVLKIIAIIINFIKYKKFVIIHTYLNKLTGLMLFIIVYMLNFSTFSIYLIIIGCIATITSIEEILISTTSNKLNLNRKSIITKT